MLTMDYVYVDQLLPDQLMEGDLIEFSDEFINEIGRVISIQEEQVSKFYKEFNYIIQGKNEFDEILEMTVSDSTYLKLFVLK